jgi:Undecaprenyl-phosphate galactose phosphotransferase WbaP
MSVLDSRTVLTPSAQFAAEPIQRQFLIGPSLTGIRRRLIVAGSLVFGDILTGAAFSAMLALLNSRVPPAIELRAFNFVPLILPVLLLCFGLYGNVAQSPVERLRLRTLALIVLASIGLTYSLAAGGAVIVALASIVCVPTLLALGYYVEALVRSLLIRAELWTAPVALVGRDQASQILADKLRARPEMGLRPVAIIESLRSQMQSERMNDEAMRKIEAILLSSNEEFVVSGIRQASPLRFRRVIIVQPTMDFEEAWLQTRNSGNVVGVEIKPDIYLAHHLFLKRVLDCAVAIPGALVALPIIAILGIAIKIIDPGPAIYRQVRVGRNGRPIRVLKLRTMFVDAEERLGRYLAQNEAARAEWESYYKLRHDPRVLPIIGGFLRRASLDELPQLFNIIRGEMSLVGPRPLPGYHMEAFDQNFQTVRSGVPVGLTGLWQISARSDGDLRIQQALDVAYIRNWSIWLDLYILLQTALAVLRAKGAR